MYRRKRKKRNTLLVVLLILIPVILLFLLSRNHRKPEPVIFSVEDAALVGVHSTCVCEADVTSLLLKKLDWDLTGSGPRVLIIHTHGTEAYTKEPGADYTESDPYRTMDDRYNMISIGKQVAKILTDHGIRVIHDTELYDYPSYDGAYDNARLAIQAYLEKYPTIELVLDIHRDAVELEDGTQWAPTTEVNGKPAAKVMITMGTGCAENNHPDWLDNMALAVKLDAQLEKLYPGLCRDITLRSSRFNQDLLPGMLLVEVGTAGNTHPEAKRAAEALAQGIVTLAGGAN